MKTNLRNLKFNILSNLQSALPLETHKNILVSSPHPGSAKLIVNSVQNVLKSSSTTDGGSGNQVELVDYQTALHFVDHILPTISVTSDEINTNSFSLKPPMDLAPTKAFAPGLYEIEDVVPFDEDDEEEEDSDQEEPHQNAINYRSQPQQQPRPTKHSETVAPKIVLNLNIIPSTTPGRTGPKNEGETAASPSPNTLAHSFQLSLLSAQQQQQQQQNAKRMSSENHISKNAQTIYDRVLSDKEITLYLLYLKNNIVEKFKRKEIKRAVLIARDVTDLMENARNDSGKKLFFGLNDLVAQLRNKEGISSILVGSCFPSLLDSKNVQKDVEFYTQIIDGNLPNFSSKGDLTMAADGSLFQTSLDAYDDLFDKVPLLPPAKTFHSLRALKGKKETGRSFKNQHEQQYLLFQYLSQQDRDMKLRIAEINSKMILDACMTRGITLNFSVWNLVCESKDPAVVPPSGVNTLDFSSHKEALKRQAQSPVEIYALELMTNGVWNNGKVDRLLKLAIGSKMESSASEDYNTTLLKVLDLNDFEAALKIMYETDLSRCPTVSESEKDVISPAEGDDGGSEKVLEDVQAHSETATHSKPKTVFANDPLRSDDESISAELKRLGVKLNKHEKRILSTVINPDRLSVQFNDLVLPPTTKLVLQTLVTLPLLRPQFFQSGILSRSSINGVLLFGPPGTGKTMLAKAVAKSSGAWFMNVSLSDIFEKYVGEGEKNVKAIFSLARKLGGPCIIFLDEVDAVFGTRRTDSSGSSRREIMNEFMAEWDGLISNNQGLVVLGATNRPFDLDDAILRRMPRRLLVDLPTEEARLKILETQLRGETLDESVDLKDIAKRTVNYSGSDLKNVCISAALARMKECIISDYSKTELDVEVGVDQLSKKLNEVEDWGSYLADKKVIEHSKNLSLYKRHIDIGMQECPPSLSDEMQSLLELRKWDGMYGDSSKRNPKGQKGIGFGLPTVTPPASTEGSHLLS